MTDVLASTESVRDFRLSSDGMVLVASLPGYTAYLSHVASMQKQTALHTALHTAGTTTLSLLLYYTLKGSNPRP